MLFDISRASTTTLAAEILQENTCLLCPKSRVKFPEPEDMPDCEILVLSQKSGVYPMKTIVGYPCNHRFMVECIGQNEEPDKSSKACCLGRKLNMIKELKPRLVVCISYEVFKELEIAIGHTVAGAFDKWLLPTTYQGHEFWLLCIPDTPYFHYKLGINEASSANLFEKAMTTRPTILEPSKEGIHFVTHPDELDEAFEWLAKQKRLSFDWETNGIRPYFKGSKFLSVAVGTDERVYAFPLWHRETPTNFDGAEVLRRITALPSHIRMCAHFFPFESEWGQQKIGPDFLWSRNWDDTFVQAYLLAPHSPKSLDALCRQHWGFDLKAFSDLDRSRLDDYPLEQVLMYNALDVKYTHMLFDLQQPQIFKEGLQTVYQMHIDRMVAASMMQVKGLTVNPEFCDSEYMRQYDLFQKALAAWNEVPEVQQVINKYGKCEPGSTKDLKRLFHEFLGVDDEIESFDDAFLSSYKHRVCAPLKACRNHWHMISTYLAPFMRNVEGRGKFLHDDDQVHTQLNTAKAVTGRSTSTQPNSQAYPKRGGLMYIRNSVKAPPGKIMAAIDYGQIEFLTIATITKDPVLIEAAWNDYDVHMEWAKRLVEVFPGMFIRPTPDDYDEGIDEDGRPIPREQMYKNALKAFRSEIKNRWTFPLVYKASYNTIQVDLSEVAIRGGFMNQTTRFRQVADEFMLKCAGLAAWQDSIEWQMNNKGFTRNPFGRKHRGPLTINQMVNYPIQSTASDIVMIAFSRLAQLSYLLKEPDLCPILNIHDDLTFYLDEERAPELIPIILTVMLHTESYKNWLHVPLKAELSMGRTWGSMKDVATYTSKNWSFDQFAGKLDIPNLRVACVHE